MLPARGNLRSTTLAATKPFRELDFVTILGQSGCVLEFEVQLDHSKCI